MSRVQVFSTDQHTSSGPTRDAGLQAERTALAWNRTSLAVMANAVIALRSGWVTERSAITALAAALLVAGGASPEAMDAYLSVRSVAVMNV